MKTDNYTKVLLTIIALNLTFISFQNINLFDKAYAEGPNPTSTQFTTVPVNENGTIDVRIVDSEELDVNITDINTSDELKVRLEEVDRSAFFYTTVPVKIKE
ncbi:hypothetical protein OO013_00490 [Mangrovivirga sp. M17]|uniref:Uncharacterized protein n=1 Tax=Mangrovivirga halotolerans TaxID=2993936 RepID=A0ABT3RKG5_9BACT|nr:hypothetical protein [Mangrovivirga halotolerans]MCX2742316.1 hypothetical protein [Mangrovivirga halotolerans]